MNNTNNTEKKANALPAESMNTSARSLSAAAQENWETVWSGTSSYTLSNSFTVPGLAADREVRITATAIFAVYYLDPYSGVEESYNDTVTLTNAVLPTNAYSNYGSVDFKHEGDKISIQFRPYEEEFKGFLASSIPTRVTITKVEHAVPPAVVTDDPEGVDYRQSYVEGSAGNAGAYKVNTRTGRVDFTKELFALGGERMPMGMSLSYNPYISGGTYDTKMPSGWKLNYQQYVYLDGTDYKYIDGNYRRHTFKPLAGTGRYYDTAHTGLLLTVSGSTATITDDRTNTLTFTGGKLTRVAERNGSTETATTIAYTASEMTVTDGMGRTATVTFEANEVTVKRPDDKVITLTVASGRLTEITEVAIGSNAAERHSYTYYSDGCLDTATAGHGQSVKFSYASKKVSAVTEKLNSNEVKRYVPDYRVSHTDITEYRYGYATQSLMTRNVFSDDGEAVSSYEIKDNKAAAIRTKSSEDFKSIC